MVRWVLQGWWGRCRLMSRLSGRTGCIVFDLPCDEPCYTKTLQPNRFREVTPSVFTQIFLLLKHAARWYPQKVSIFFSCVLFSEKNGTCDRRMEYYREKLYFLLITLSRNLFNLLCVYLTMLWNEPTSTVCSTRSYRTPASTNSKDRFIICRS
jgi:hypothetical protein